MDHSGLMPNYIRLSEVHAYKRSYDLSNTVWKDVLQWDWFAKRGLGKQFTEAIDSISANIAEGFGRFHKADRIKFYHYALGSRSESEDWTRKSFERGLLNQEKYNEYMSHLEKLRPEIWSLIKITKEYLKI